MSTDTTTSTSRRELTQPTCNYDISSVLADLTALGRLRRAHKDEGGPLYAAFGDFCWNTGHPLTTELFDLWLEATGIESTSTAPGVIRARRAMGAAL